MKVTVLASTSVGDLALWDAYGYDMMPAGENTTEADALGEAAGRICYKSFNRPNPKTASNGAYIANILAQGHYSVLEHASVTFLVQNVSRALLAELSRHRHLSFSVVSQRYVDYTRTEPVIPPGMAGDPLAVNGVRLAYTDAIERYADLVAWLSREHGMKRKHAREAARCVLPNAAPVDMVVTGNLRAWRDVLSKRHHVAADAELQVFARKTLAHLRNVAPASFQDVPEYPYGSEE